MRTISPWFRFNKERLLLALRCYFSSILTCIKFLFLYPFFRPRLANVFSVGTLSLQNDLEYGIPEIRNVDLWELFPGIEGLDTTIGKLFPNDGSTISFQEAVALGTLIRHFNPKRVFEIGTSQGTSAYNIAINMADNTMLFTLDLPPANQNDVETRHRVTVLDRNMIFADRQSRRFLDSVVNSRITQLYGDSATFDYSPYSGTCDIVFIDGSHSYEYVRSDTETALLLIKPGGLIIWHDFNNSFTWPDVSIYLRKEAAKRKLTRIKGTTFCVYCHPPIPEFINLK